MKIRLIPAIIFLISSIASATSAMAKTPLQQHLQAIIQQYPEAHIGIMVKSIKNNKTLFQINSKQRFVPASILKVVTAIAALDYLGSNFQYQTNIRLNKAQIHKHTLQGPLTIQFSADPSLTHQQLAQLIGQLNKKGINKITGNIIIDTQAFDNVPYPPGRIWDDLSYSYGTPVQSANLDNNEWQLQLSANKKIGAPANLINIDELPHTKFINHTITTTGWKKYCPIAIYHLPSNTFLLRGCIPHFVQPQIRLLALFNTMPLIKQTIIDALKQTNISWQGQFSNQTKKTTWKSFSVS